MSTEGRTKKLKVLWEELNPVPPQRKLEAVQDKVYDSVAKAMKAHKRSAEIDAAYLHPHGTTIVQWLKDVHGLASLFVTVERGVNPSTHDAFQVRVLQIKW